MHLYLRLLRISEHDYSEAEQQALGRSPHHGQRVLAFGHPLSLKGK